MGNLSSPTPDATTVTKGKIQLAGDLAGTAASPNVRKMTDASGNELLLTTSTVSAVNELTIGNAASLNPPTITATGGDTNISINLVTKGAGSVLANNTLIATANNNLNLTNKTIDATGTGNSITNVSNFGFSRRNNTTNITEAGAKIQTGWVAIAVASTTPNASATITFPVAFTNVPIVNCTFGGDTAGATSTLGSGAANVQGAGAMARSVTTTTFIATAGTFNAANNWTSGNTVYIHWTAIGV